MPTVFDRLTGALNGNDVSVRVSGQSTALTQIASTVAGLIQHPPHDIGDLGSAIQALPLPDLKIPADFGKALNSLIASMPKDLSSVTHDLGGGLQSLESQLGDLAKPLEDLLKLAKAIYDATQVDIFCKASGTASQGTPAAAAPMPSPFDGLSTILDQLPSPMNVNGLLSWLDQHLHALDTSGFQLSEIPVFDSLRYPLTTLFNWRHMPPADILTSMSDTFADLEALVSSAVDKPLAPMESAISAINNQFPTAVLVDVSDQLATNLNALTAAIHAKDVSLTKPAVDAVNTQLDSYAVVQQNVRGPLGDTFAALAKGLPTLAHDLEDEMGRLASMLQTESPLSFIPDQPATLAPATASEFTDSLGSLQAGLQGLLDQLDLSAIQGPLSTVADAMQQAVDGLDSAKVKITIQVQSLFAGVQKIVDQVDIAALLANVQAAISSFQATLIQKLQALFAPVRTAVAKVIDEISTGVSSFDPASIVQALRDAIGRVTGVLKDPEVASAINDIRSAIEQTAKALEALSFAPLTDQVIADIKQVTESLKKIDTTQLSMPLQLALQAALAILPSDLTPFSDPLIADLQKLINEGPAPLLATLQKQPDLLLDQVRKFEPAQLLGNALGAPYRNLLQQMQTFKPSKLLEPVQGELEKLKSRLRSSANPGTLLQPLETLFNQLLQAFDQLKPSNLIAPLNQALTNVIQGVFKALPVDEVFTEIDKVLAAIQQVASAGDRGVALLKRIADMLSSLAKPRQQLDAWMADTLAGLNSITDASPLQPKLDSLNAALAKTRSATLVGRLGSATAPLLQKLDALDPLAKRIAIIQAYTALPKAELAALPNTPEKAAITSTLARFNPVDESFGTPYQLAAQSLNALKQAGVDLGTVTIGWDQRFHEDGPLKDVAGLDATSANLKQWIGEALDRDFVRPIAAILGMADPLGQSLQPILSSLESVAGVLDAKLSLLLNGPASLTAIRDKLKTLVDKLKGLNLNFITDGLDTVFSDIRSKFAAISPTTLRHSIDSAFNAMLDTLKVSLLIPAADVSKLDSDYQAIVDKLKQLDPEKLIVEIVQPEFEKTVPPLLKIFDPSDILKRLFDQFTRVDENLKSEMARVNQAYQELRQAIPSIHISLDIDVDIGASLPF